MLDAYAHVFMADTGLDDSHYSGSDLSDSDSNDELDSNSDVDEAGDGTIGVLFSPNFLRGLLYICRRSGK